MAQIFQEIPTSQTEIGKTQLDLELLSSVLSQFLVAVRLRFICGLVAIVDWLIQRYTAF
jgi:hypothetical protein